MMRAGLLIGLVLSLFSPLSLAVMPELTESVVFSCEGHTIATGEGEVAKASFRYSHVGVGDKSKAYFLVEIESVGSAPAQFFAYAPNPLSIQNYLLDGGSSLQTATAFLNYQNDDFVDDVSRQAMAQIRVRDEKVSTVQFAFAGYVATFSDCKSAD